MISEFIHIHTVSMDIVSIHIFISFNIHIKTLHYKVVIAIPLPNFCTGAEVWEWDGDDDLIMQGFDMDIEGDEYMDGNYVHTHGMDVDKLRNHMNANLGSYNILPMYEDAILETWDATEDITAFYGMANMLSLIHI